jgi:hypothetical protein
MMQEQIIFFLINEGYVNDEISAYKILDVISESFYYKILNEVLTPEQRAAGRARVAARMSQLGISQRSPEETAQVMGNIRQRQPGIRAQSSNMRTNTGASLPDTGRGLGPSIVNKLDSQATGILSKVGSSATSGPVNTPSYINSSGEKVPLTSSDRQADRTGTMGGMKGSGLDTPGSSEVQGSNYTRRSVSGRNINYSDNPSGSSVNRPRQQSGSFTTLPSQTAQSRPAIAPNRNRIIGIQKNSNK